jgi:hypothetical protein
MGNRQPPSRPSPRTVLDTSAILTTAPSRTADPPGWLTPHRTHHRQTPTPPNTDADVVGPGHRGRRSPHRGLERTVSAAAAAGSGGGRRTTSRPPPPQPPLANANQQNGSATVTSTENPAHRHVSHTCPRTPTVTLPRLTPCRCGNDPATGFSSPHSHYSQRRVCSVTPSTSRVDPTRTPGTSSVRLLYHHGGDPLLIANPRFVQVTVGYVSALHFGAFYPVLIYALVRGRDRIRLPAVFYAGMIIMGTGVYLAVGLLGDAPLLHTACGPDSGFDYTFVNPTLSLALNLPYPPVALLLVARISPPHPITRRQRQRSLSSRHQPSLARVHVDIMSPPASQHVP